MKTMKYINDYARAKGYLVGNEKLRNGSRRKLSVTIDELQIGFISELTEQNIFKNCITKENIKQ